MMQTEFDAIVIGAGVGGSASAILLADAGWSVALIERENFPRRKVCGECVAASNLGLLDFLGVGEAFSELAGPDLKRVAWCAGESIVEAELPECLDGKHPWGRALGREHLDTLLVNRARQCGVTVLQPCSARFIGKVGALQECEVIRPDRSSFRIAAKTLVAAHGSWQADPLDEAVTRRPKKPSDLFAFKANFSSARLAAGVLPVLAFPGGYGGMVQADSGLLTLACCVRRDRLQQWRRSGHEAAAGEAVQMRLQNDVRVVREALDGARREGTWLSVGPIRPRIGNPSPREGVHAVGNAAGEAHPILGEGMSMALQSAFLLCRRLIGEPTTTSERYSTNWRAAFSTRIRLAAIYAHMSMSPPATRVALSVLRRYPGLLGVGARWGGKTRCAVDLQWFRDRAS